MINISTFGSSVKAAGRGRSRRRGLATLFATLALLAIPATALGQNVDPTGAQYNPVNEQIDQGPGTLTETQSGVPGEPPSTDRVIGDLPFTGLDVGLLIAAAVLLGSSGLVLRRLSRASSRG